MHLVLLGTSFILSRLVFFIVDDPEGPNLLIVSVLAIVIYVVLYEVCKWVNDK